MAITYTPIATQTLSSNVSDVTFSSISSAYTDLILSCSVVCSSTQTLYMRFNGVAGTSYSSTYIFGNGSSAGSGRQSNDSRILLGSINVGMSTTNYSVVNAHIFNYTNTTTNKTVISRQSLGSAEVNLSAGMFRDTSAITSLVVLPSSGTLNAGSTFTLYGIKAA